MKILVLLIFSILAINPALAKESIFRVDNKTMRALHPEETAQADLLTFIGKDEFVKQCRFGMDKDKSLGSYLPEPEMVYKTGYKKLDDGTKTYWALKLGWWYQSQGGGGKNFIKNTKKNLSPKAAQKLYEISYSDLEEFAKGYWVNNKNFKSPSITPKDWFLHEAIVDGMTIWLYSQQNANNFGKDENVRIREYLQKIKNRKP